MPSPASAFRESAKSPPTMTTTPASASEKARQVAPGDRRAQEPRRQQQHPQRARRHQHDRRRHARQPERRDPEAEVKPEQHAGEQHRRAVARGRRPAPSSATRGSRKAAEAHPPHRHGERGGVGHPGERRAERDREHRGRQAAKRSSISPREPLRQAGRNGVRELLAELHVSKSLAVLLVVEVADLDQHRGRDQAST